jgi:hypothetical protein
MTRPSPAATVVKTVERDVCTVPVCTRCNVCYEFDTRATNRDLAIPYRVSLNGKVLESATTQRKLGANRKIILQAEPGSRIALFLNSDVHPKFRKHPVYEAVVGANDVHIKITEKKNKHAESAVLVPSQPGPAQPGQRGLDTYEAALTGDIWMHISHRYTEAEADAMLPKDMPLAIRDAVLRIYAGLKSIQLEVYIPAIGAAAAMKMNLRFQESDNAKEHINSCSLLKDVLPRTHPHAFAALMTEAYAAGVNHISLTSCWRPMLGSIVHRAGLGLDVVHIASDTQKVAINRAGLKEKNRSIYVSEQEIKAYDEYMDALDKNRNISKSSEGNNEAVPTKKAREKWQEEMIKGEPALMTTLRKYLINHQSIKQILDPWYLETNSKDMNEKVANEQRSSLENLHNNHLHITIMEPNIL